MADAPAGPNPLPTRSQQANLLLGRIALERGLITREQLEEGLREQARESAGGRSPRPIGVILVAQQYLTDAQLVALLEDQKMRLRQPAPPRPEAAAGDAQARQEDVLLGKLLVRHGLTTAAQINECLRLQAEAQERGGAPLRLGELLVQKGFASQESIARVLSLQQKTILTCPRCDQKYNVTGYAEGREYRCKKCNGPLVAPRRLNDVHVAGSSPALPAVTGPGAFPIGEDLPADVAAAAKNPLSHFGKYLLVKELGRGGMGVVYKAWQTDLRRVVAVKLLSSRSSSSVGLHPSATDEEVKRFYREAQTAAKLKHPNIVSIFEVGQHQNHYYLTMEFIEGQTLERWIRSGRLHEGGEAGPRASQSGAAARRSAEIVRDVALAVQAAHDQHIVHRDLKPQNILMDETGVPHVTDFGLAKSMQAKRKDAATLTVSGIILGTPAYMSPEQASGGKVPVDARSDVYSLGAILYECLCGKPPFSGGSSLDIVMQVLKAEPPPPSAVGKTAVPKELEIICLKAMEKTPERRYPAAKALAEDLDRWLQGESILARPQSTWYRLQKRVRTNPVLASALAAAAVCLIAVGAVALSGPNKRKLQLEEIQKLLDKGDAQYGARNYVVAQSQYEEALKIAGEAQAAAEQARAAEGRKKCEAALARAAQLKREQEEAARIEKQKMVEALAAAQKELEELRKRREKGDLTDEQKKDIARREEEAAQRIAALTGGTTRPPTPPPTPAPVPPPTTPTPPKPPDRPPTPAAAVPSPPVPFQGEGPKLIAAHRYGELRDRLQHDRSAFGPVTDHQVAGVRSGAEILQTLMLHTLRFRELKPRLPFPILKTMPDLAEAAIAKFEFTAGRIDLDIKMRDGSGGTISESVANLTTEQLVDLARVCSPDDAPMHVHYGNLFALHGELDRAVAELLKARQLGGQPDFELASVVEAACALPEGKDPAAAAAHADAVQKLLDKHGKTLPDADRARLEAAVAAAQKLAAELRGAELIRQAEKALEGKKYADVRALAARVQKECPGTRAEADARALLDRLPHPDGRLLYGFEPGTELKGWGKSDRALFRLVGDPGLAHDGTGALQLLLTGQGGPRGGGGSIVGFKTPDVRFDQVRSVNLWVRDAGGNPGKIMLALFTDNANYYFSEFTLDRNWKAVRLPTDRFLKEGRPDWTAVDHAGFMYFGGGVVEFLVDSIRLQEE